MNYVRMGINIIVYVWFFFVELMYKNWFKYFIGKFYGNVFKVRGIWFWREGF